MNGFANNQEAVSEEAPDATGLGRQKSSRPFPYIALPDVVELAEVVYGRGLRCQVDEVAADLRQQTTSGAFRSRMSAGRMFGVVDVNRGAVSLTELGQQIVNSDTRSDALVQAFMNVELYRVLYNTFAGSKLPPDTGIEAEMRRLGLPAKQVQKARQVMFRSAEEAGFFRSGRDRLVSPPRGNVARVATSATVSSERREAKPDAPMADHPLIKGLVAKLPAEDERFTERQRKRWLEAAKVLLELIYAGEDDEAAEVPPANTPGPQSALNHQQLRVSDTSDGSITEDHVSQ